MTRASRSNTPAKPGSIKLACADFTFPLVSHETSLDLIASLGFKGVDVGFFEGRSHVQPSTALKNPAVSARKLKTLCGDRGLAIADLRSFPVPTRPPGRAPSSWLARISRSRSFRTKPRWISSRHWVSRVWMWDFSKAAAMCSPPPR